MLWRITLTVDQRWRILSFGVGKRDLVVRGNHIFQTEQKASQQSVFIDTKVSSHLSELHNDYVPANKACMSL